MLLHDEQTGQILEETNDNGVLKGDTKDVLNEPFSFMTRLTLSHDATRLLQKQEGHGQCDQRGLDKI